MIRLRYFTLIWLMVLVLLGGCELNRPADTEPTPSSPDSGPAPVVLSTATPTTETETEPATEPVSDTQDLDSSSEAITQQPATYFVSGTVLIQFKSNIAANLPQEKQQDSQGLSIGIQSLDPDFQRLGITSLEPLLGPSARALGQDFGTLSTQAGEIGRLYVAEFDHSQEPKDIAAALSANDQIEFAEPNFVAFANDRPAFKPLTFRPNDEHFDLQWHLEAIQMEAAWDISRGQGVTIAILDTGVAYENFAEFRQAPDLAGTQFAQGFDFVNNDSHPNDDHGHGTHVAGTLAQTTNNSEGTAGVAFQARILPIKTLDARGTGSYEGIIQGIHFAVNNGAKVINLSLNGYSDSQALKAAVDFAHSRNVVVVAATGNSGSTIGYPALYNNTIAVGAVRFDQTRARYSNYGPKIDLVAPGGDNQIDQNGDGFGDGILQQTFKPNGLNNFKYLFFEGTSMAAPHVSGVVALLLSQNPSWTPNQVRNRLTATAKDLGPAGFDDQYGYGLVQAANALGASPSPATATPTPTPTPTNGGPTATSTPTPTITPTLPPPPPGSNLLQNSSFETNAAWVFGETYRPGRYANERARTGSRSVVVGITDVNKDLYSFSSAAQRVTIPANANRVTLTAYIYPVTQTLPDSNPIQYQDRQIISVLDAYFREIDRLHNSLSNSQTWEQKTFDLTRYRGRTIYIYFGVVNRSANGKLTSMYVDDVSLVASQ